MMRIKISQVLVTPSGKSSSPPHLASLARCHHLLCPLAADGQHSHMTSSSEEENVEKRRGGGGVKKSDEREKAEGRAKLDAKEKKEKRTLGTPSSGSGVQVPVSLSLEAGGLVKFPPLGS